MPWCISHFCQKRYDFDTVFFSSQRKRRQESSCVLFLIPKTCTGKGPGSVEGSTQGLSPLKCSTSLFLLRHLAVATVFAQALVWANSRTVAIFATALDPVVRAATAYFAVVPALVVRAPAQTARVALTAIMAQTPVRLT